MNNMSTNRNGSAIGCHRRGPQTPKEGIHMKNTSVSQATHIGYSLMEQRRKQERKQSRWLHYPAHAQAVAAVKPEWADDAFTEVTFDDDSGRAESIVFSRRVGEVAIEQMAVVEDGRIFAAGEPQILVNHAIDQSGLSIGNAATVGVDLIKAAQILNGSGEVTASMFEIVANALGINPVDLYALANVDEDPENDITLGDLFRMSRYIGLSPTEMFARAHPDEFDVKTAEEEAHLGRYVGTGEPFTIVLDHESQGGLSRDGARALARRLNNLADDWDREESRPALRRLPNVDDELRERDV